MWYDISFLSFPCIFTVLNCALYCRWVVCWVEEIFWIIRFSFLCVSKVVSLFDSVRKIHAQRFGENKRHNSSYEGKSTKDHKRRHLPEFPFDVDFLEFDSLYCKLMAFENYSFTFFSALIGCWSSVLLGGLKYVSFWLHSFCVKWEGWDPVNWFNHTGWVAVVTPTDRSKSVRNRWVIEVFSGVFVLSHFLFIFYGCRAFCHRTESYLLLFLFPRKNGITRNKN